MLIVIMLLWRMRWYGSTLSLELGQPDSLPLSVINVLMHSNFRLGARVELVPLCSLYITSVGDLLSVTPSEAYFRVIHMNAPSLLPLVVLSREPRFSGPLFVARQIEGASPKRTRLKGIIRDGQPMSR